MMKFPKPRHLTVNEYPDLPEDQPTIIRKLVQSGIKPNPATPEADYIEATIAYIKQKSKESAKKVTLYSTNVGRKLYFVTITFPPSTEPVLCLVDTGASNSLLHQSVTQKLSLPVTPTSMRMSTAAGTSSNIIVGTSHRKFQLTSAKDEKASFCTNFIVTNKLNGMQCILGAEFLLDEKRVLSISASNLIVSDTVRKYAIPISSENPPDATDTVLLDNVSVQENASPDASIVTEPDCEPDEDPPIGNFTDDLTIAQNFNHNIDADFENETLPPSEQFFDNTYELKFEALEKKLTLDDADYSDCPRESLMPLRRMLDEYEDRFSKSKLDLETTSLYEASLPTLPGRIVTQRVRRLPPHKYNFAIQAIKQLQESGVVRESDSPWRSNVVLVPKPASQDEERENTKADQQTGEQNRSALYRICLDFRELNTCLEFPQQTSFTTADEIIFKLRNKVVVSMDISSAFFIIPIREEDRYKTAFWVNNLAFEFNVAVMGLKSSPYHLNKFIERAFDAETFRKLKEQLPPEEREMAPNSFRDIFISYFDDFFVYADDYPQCILALKLVLQASRLAGIKFSAEKTKFLTTKIKVLGYGYDTRELHLTMNKNKSSAFENMKKPSSLYELHSRLASFQYQQQFLPFIKHILYPLNFLLRKKMFRWTEVEERAWQTAITLTKLGIQLTIPDPEDTLVLTTDASKVAAAAVLFRVRNDKLELVSATSKYFSTADLGKSSYFLEAISLAYGIKSFAAYLLNCQSKIIIYTDAKALIYAKRMSTHSILLNNTLTYLTNFVSIANVDLYHLPGTVNVLADVLSRSIADNLNSRMPKEHPISKQWASVLPPLPPKFGVTHDVLYRFLTQPLLPEPQDIHDRSLRRLMEPKSIQTIYKESQAMTPEERYHSAQTLLNQWLSEYAPKNPPVNTNTASLYASKLELDLQTQKLCMEKIEEIMTKYYDDIKGSPLFRALQKNLEEVSKHYLSCSKNPLTEQLLGKLKRSQQDLMDTAQIINQDKVASYAATQLKSVYINSIQTQEQTTKIPLVYFTLHPEASILPNLSAESNGLDIPLQETTDFKPFELKKIDLQIRFQIPKHHCGLLMNKSSARTKYGVNVQLGLIDVGYHGYVIAAIQNMSDYPIRLERGTAVAQLLIIPSQIPTFEDSWPLSTSTRGSFGSTGQSFKEKASTASTNYSTLVNELEILPSRHGTQNAVPFRIEKREQSCPLAEIEDRLNPAVISLNGMRIRMMSDPVDNTQVLYDLQCLENELLDKASPCMLGKLPIYQTNIASDVYIKRNKKEPSEDEADTIVPPPEEFSRKLFPKHYTVPITPDDLSHLLAAELIQHKKLSLETLIYLQSMDPHISKVKDKMLDKKSYKNYVLKKGVVCKSPKPGAAQSLAIYLPSVLLYPTAVYVHKFFLHPSHSQTVLEFSNHYFHPQSKRAIAQICQACLTCSLTHNPEYRLIPVGRERSIVPTKPREAISMDIMYLPRSSKGHTHALLIADLYSMYLSFFPLRGKSSESVAAALSSYISMQGVPKIIFSDNDPSFRGEVEKLLLTHNVQHATSYPYVQRGNTVEAQVRKVKNAARAAIMDNPITNHAEWHNLYPLVIVRLNTMLSKYGASRELIHFQDTLHTHIPLITSVQLHDELEADLHFKSEKLRKQIGRFLRNKHKSKEHYKEGRTYPYLLHELVMRKIYTPESPFHPTFTGPFRVIELHPQGATLKNTRTGEVFSAHYMNMRKISVDEFITLLPDDFDSDILKNVGAYRYNKNHLPDPSESPLFAEPDDAPSDPPAEPVITDEPLRPKPIDKLSNFHERTLRSGKVIRINTHTLPSKIRSHVLSAFFTYAAKIKKSNGTKYLYRPCMTASLTTPRTPYADYDQTMDDGCYFFNSSIRMVHPENHHKGPYKSNYNSPLPGYLVVTLDTEPDSTTRVKFSTTTVKFYDAE